MGLAVKADDFRNGSKGEIAGCPAHVCFGPKSGHPIVDGLRRVAVVTRCAPRLAGTVDGWRSLRNRSQGPSESVSLCGDRATAPRKRISLRAIPI